jgi:uncharacterized protein
MFIKVHQAYRSVVAVCDSDLIGKKFEEGRAVLDVRDDFYRGEEKGEDEIASTIVDMAKEDATFNIIGKDSIKIALEVGLISEEGTKTIQGVPYALVLL